jgi:phage terminase large subunit-like protein
VPTPRRELAARGSWRAKDRPEEAPPPRRIGRRPRELTAEEVLSGIPGYDPRLQADGFVYDHERALKAIRFFHDRLTLVEGVKPGTRFGLMPWLQAITGNTFGWVEPRTGRRRYQTVFVYVPKKNSKTTWTAGLALYVLSEEAERGIRCVSLAAGKDQTNNVFEPAAEMISNDRELRDLFEVYGHSAGATNKSIVSRSHSLSTFRGLPHDADTTDGKGPWLIIGDELHRWKNGDLLDIMRKGQASLAVQGEPLTVLTTTADYNRPSVCNQWLKRARAVRDNRGRKDEPGWEPRVLPAIYEASPKDDWRSPATHRKANPSYGVTVSPEFLADEIRAIAAEPSKLNAFLRFHLNVVTDQKEAALSLDAWDECPSEPPTDAQLRKAVAHAGLDFAHKIDLASFALWWPSLSYARWWFWIPEKRAHLAEDRDAVPYLTWARMGLVELVEGDTIDDEWVRDRVLSICAEHEVADIGFDPWACRGLALALQGRGLNMVEMRQGHQTLGEGSKALESAVVARKLNHGGNQIARWNAGNLQWRRDPNGNICPDKQDRPNLRIDGMVALVMAMTRALGAKPRKQGSVYSRREPIVA